MHDIFRVKSKNTSNQFFNTYTPHVDSKNISCNEDNITFPLAAFTGSSGRSPMAFAAALSFIVPISPCFWKDAERKGKDGGK